MTNLPASLPIEEALEYLATYNDTVARNDFRKGNYTVDLGVGFNDFVLGICPVRNSSSMWLIDDKGQFWTSRFWHDQGDIIECCNGERTLVTPWPLHRGERIDYSALMLTLRALAPLWGTPGHVLAIEEFGGVYFGPWPDMSNADRRTIRALMIYGFDNEWGKGAFTRSIQAARHKHRRSVHRIKRRQLHTDEVAA